MFLYLHILLTKTKTDAAMNYKSCHLVFENNCPRGIFNKRCNDSPSGLGVCVVEIVQQLIMITRNATVIM